MQNTLEIMNRLTGFESPTHKTQWDEGSMSQADRDKHFELSDPSAALRVMARSAHIRGR